MLASEHCLSVIKQDLMLSLVRGQSCNLAELPTNPTVIPDNLFNTLRPVILIRNPLRQVQSNLEGSFDANPQMRPGDEDFTNTSSLALSRYLFEDFRKKGMDPVVVDGDDVVWRTEDMKVKLCYALGLNPGLVCDKWEPVPLEDRPTIPMMVSYLQTIHDSTGIERPDSKVSSHHLGICDTPPIRS